MKDEGAKNFSPVSCRGVVCECRGDPDPSWSPVPEKSKSQIFCLAFFYFTDCSRGNVSAIAALSVPTNSRSPVCISGRRISRGCSAMRRISSSGDTSSRLSFSVRAEGLRHENMSVGGVSPSNSRSSSSVNSSLKKSLSSTFTPSRESHAFTLRQELHLFQV